MPIFHTTALMRIFQLLAGLLIVKVLVGVVRNYYDYLPPNFDADFLLGREAYFWHGYHWPFFIHIVSGPCSLILGMILISDQYRRRFPRWHRFLGRVQAIDVLFVVAPSGFCMAFYAANGPLAGVGFGLLSILTGLTVALGWRAAMEKRFDVHRRWMSRCFLLLCSTVVLRLNAGLGESLGIHAEWFYMQSAWTSWLVPWLVFEWFQRAGRNPRHLLSTEVTSAG